MGLTMTMKKVPSLLLLSVVLSFTVVGIWAGAAQKLVKVDDDNWADILEGEWMVEFFAPWCPACRNLQPVWEDFASWSDDLGIKVGQVDITSSPGLSGRFMITALPTIFHVKDGVFRQYKGSRSKDEFLGFVEEKRWEKIEPISSWQAPNSLQMTVLSQFYKISMSLRNVMNVMLEQYGIPTWAAYLMFGLATIIIGLIMGLILVCVIDFFYPPNAVPLTPPRPRGDNAADRRDRDSDEDDFTEEIQDEGSQGEDANDNEVEEEAGKSSAEEGSGNEQKDDEEEEEAVPNVDTPQPRKRGRRRD